MPADRVAPIGTLPIIISAVPAGSISSSMAVSLPLSAAAASISSSSTSSGSGSGLGTGFSSGSVSRTTGSTFLAGSAGGTGLAGVCFGAAFCSCGGPSSGPLCSGAGPLPGPSGASSGSSTDGRGWPAASEVGRVSPSSIIISPSGIIFAKSS